MKILEQITTAGNASVSIRKKKKNKQLGFGFVFPIKDIPQELQGYSWLGHAILFNTSHSF